MKTHFLRPALAIFLSLAIIAPSAFLVAPQRAHALFGAGDVVFDPTNYVQTAISAIKNTITAAASVTSSAANVAMQINEYVFQPLAFILSGDLLRMITAGVIAFVIGEANGTGIPQFVTDVQKSMQTVSDSQALAFFEQFELNSNSPFAGSIIASLRKEYLNKTSLAGFWADNMCTLAQTSPDVNAYLAGDWSQGGVAAWFALTTQDENNPYMLYQSSRTELSTIIGSGVDGATGARIAELGWGNGLMSWCGSVGNSYAPLTNGSGINPGDPCINADGTAGTIKTPGSVIVATLNKALGGQQDQIVRLGNVGPEINSILGNIATVMKTAQFGVSLLGGTDSGGLLGINQTTGSETTSQLMQYQSESGNLGLTESQVYQDAVSTLPSSSDLSTRIAQYQSAWNTISTAANTAATDVTTLANYCTSQANVAENLIQQGTYANNSWAGFVLNQFVTSSRVQAAAAQSALTGQIGSALSQVSAASTTIANATAELARIQNESVNPSQNTSLYTLNSLSLQTIAPTISDVVNAQQDAMSFGTAVANPDGSLSVTADSLLDKMNLISQNAQTLKVSCNLPPITSYLYGF